MPRKNREVPPGCVLHIVNRGNDKRVIFPEPIDYAAFLVLLREARERFGVELYAYCLMPNHFHLVVKTAGLDEISAYMHFVQRAHACDLRRCWRTRGQGHVFQRRYWSRVVTGDGYLVTVMKYVEANPYRAGLLDPSQVWEWSSLWDRETGERDLLQQLPIWLPEGWRTIVTVPLPQVDLNRIRKPIERGRPTPPPYASRKNEAGSLRFRKP
jgi:putative transposase